MPALLNNFPLADKTTFRIGGPAAAYCAPSSERDIVDSLCWARDNGSGVLVLGKGSNVLIADAGWDGLVIDLADAWTGTVWDHACATCRSGTLLHALVKDSVERGLAGLEKLAGIPGSVGGAIVMNAGAFGQTVFGCLTSVDVIDPLDARLKTLPAGDMNPSYRDTAFKATGAIVIAGRFCFVQDVSGRARDTFREVLAKRKDRHPLDLPNCGSVFKNPPAADATAGKLIEQCGLKGTARGRAQVSVKHANFIVNLGNATARDVRSLIVHVQKTVFDQTGILLEPEVVFAGDFTEPLFTPQ